MRATRVISYEGGLLVMRATRVISYEGHEGVISCIAVMREEFEGCLP